MTTIEHRLVEIAADPAMGRRLRHLKAPEDVKITFRGAKTQSTGPASSEVEGKYTFTLGDLKESVSFWVRGGDFFTRPLKITLVPPPSLNELNLDNDEPAYLYWRLVGDQSPLKGKKQIFRGQKAAIGGERTSIDVPLGSTITLRARVDRPLKESILIRPASQNNEAGVVVPESVPVVRDRDGKGFSVSFANVRRTMDFQFEFNDLDNVQGSRKIHIRPIDDQPPDIANFELPVTLRKGKFKDAIQRLLAGGAADGYLITPRANLPVSGTIKDDVELTKLVWAFETQPITIERSEKGPDRIILQGNPIIRRTGLIASLFHHAPMGHLQLLAAPGHLDFVSKFIALDLKQKQADPERFAPVASFGIQLQRVEETPLDKLDALLGSPPKDRFRLREHNLKDVESFNVREHLPDLRVTETGSPKEIFHVLKLSLVATDNNVETGPSTTRSRSPIQFLIVSEGELLAQVGLEEEVLHDRFEKVVAKLKVGPDHAQDAGPDAEDRLARHGLQPDGAARRRGPQGDPRHGRGDARDLRRLLADPGGAEGQQCPGRQDQRHHEQDRVAARPDREPELRRVRGDRRRGPAALHEPRRGRGGEEGRQEHRVTRKDGGRRVGADGHPDRPDAGDPAGDRSRRRLRPDPGPGRGSASGSGWRGHAAPRLSGLCFRETVGGADRTGPEEEVEGCSLRAIEWPESSIMSTAGGFCVGFRRVDRLKVEDREVRSSETGATSWCRV